MAAPDFDSAPNSHSLGRVLPGARGGDVRLLQMQLDAIAEHLAAGRLDQAKAICREGLKANRDQPHLIHLSGVIARARGDLAKAAELMRRSIQLNPDVPQFHNNLGELLRSEGKLAEAVECFRRAIRIDPQFADARNNIGLALQQMGRLADAIAELENALRLNPRLAMTQSNLGAVIGKRDGPAAAIPHYQRAIQSDPHYATAHSNLGKAWLLLGDFDRGWPEHEWRFRSPQAQKFEFPQPRWDGMPIPGRTLLVHAEQGMGDMIQFVRLIKPIADRCGKVILQCDPALMELLKSVAGVAEVVATGKPLPPFDFYIPVLSLPMVLAVTLQTIPAEIPYLAAPAESVAKWRAKLASLLPAGVRKVGLVWAGNPNHLNDRNRSMPLAKLGGLASVSGDPGVAWVALQKGVAEEHPDPPGMKIVRLGRELSTFADTAAVMGELDLVISVDTAPAHLAGALGRPVWVLLPHAPDWRWLLERTDSPWYPSMRLFRQSKAGDWAEVVARAAEALNERGCEFDCAPDSHSPGRAVQVARGGDVRLLQKQLDAIAEHLAAGRLDQADVLCRHALRDYRDQPHLIHLSGFIARQRDNPAKAAELMRRSIQLNPDVPQFHNNLGELLRSEGKYSEAAERFRRAIRLDPQFADARNNLGLALQQMGRLDDAITELQSAVRLNPRSAVAHNSLGAAIEKRDGLVAAIPHFRRAVELDPRYTKAQANLGNALAAARRPAEALAAYDAALASRPDDVAAHLGRSLMWLLMGDFDRGWREYEWRLKSSQARKVEFSQPRWDGTPIPGRTLLVHAEQGLGDTIQFVRFITPIAERCGRVILQCDPTLVELLKSVAGVSEIVATGKSLPPFDFHIPLLSLPMVLAVTLQNIRAETPYLTSPAESAATWKAKLASLVPAGMRKVGLVWAGNPNQPNDRNRSMPLARLGGLAGVSGGPGVAWVSLQKGAGEDQADPPGMKIVRLGRELSTLSDTAAVIQELDLVISVDTAPAHLAGALGRPVWVLLSHAADWRYLLDRTDSPWYPSMRLFRQSKAGDWTEVVARVAGALNERGW